MFSAVLRRPRNCIAQRCFSAQATLTPSRVNVQWSKDDSTVATFPHQWLRDHCQCPKCYNAHTNQRQVDTFLCREDSILSAQLVDSQSLQVEFQSHTTSFSMDWLKSHALPSKSLHSSFPFRKVGFQPSKKLWTKDTLSLPEVAYEDYMNEEEAEKEALHGLDAYGLLLVKGTPTEDMKGTEAFGVKLGHFIQPTLYGTMWSTHASRQESSSTQDTAYGSDALECHTDCTYLRETPGIQIFNCAIAAEKGGANRFVDGFEVVDNLSMEALGFFATHAVPFGCKDDGFDLRTEVRMIEGHAEGDQFVVDHFRHNDYDRRTLTHWDAETVEAFYEHQAELTRCIRRPEMESQVRLDPGDMIVVDNHRVMHGRYGFEGTRALIGCYLNRDCVDSRIRTKL